MSRSQPIPAETFTKIIHTDSDSIDVYWLQCHNQRIKVKWNNVIPKHSCI